MGLFGIFKRPKTAKAKRDALPKIVGAEATLRSKHSCIQTGKAAICFKPVDSPFFSRLSEELKSSLWKSIRSTTYTFQVQEDSHGYKWLVVSDRYFDELASVVHLVDETFASKDLDSTLLAAVFEFKREAQTLYWVYNYKRGLFYPFVPLPGNMQRDNSFELQLKTWMEGELPLEPSLEQWYGLWGIPIS